MNGVQAVARSPSTVSSVALRRCSTPEVGPTAPASRRRRDAGAQGVETFARRHPRKLEHGILGER